MNDYVLDNLSSLSADSSLSFDNSKDEDYGKYCERKI